MDIHWTPQDHAQVAKDGRLVVEIETKKEDRQDLPGWLDKKNKWVRVFDVKTDRDGR